MKRATLEHESLGRQINAKSNFIALVAFLCLIAALAFEAYAASTDEKLVSKFVGKNWVNGRSWEKLDYSGKLGFVCGLFDGITLFRSAAEAGKKGNLDAIYHGLSIPSTLTVGDVVEGMDEFYEDAANTVLPAICAYLYYANKSRGESSESLQKRLILWRKIFDR